MVWKAYSVQIGVNEFQSLCGIQTAVGLQRVFKMLTNALDGVEGTECRLNDQGDVLPPFLTDFERQATQVCAIKVDLTTCDDPGAANFKRESESIYNSQMHPPALSFPQNEYSATDL